MSNHHTNECGYVSGGNGYVGAKWHNNSCAFDSLFELLYAAFTRDVTSWRNLVKGIHPDDLALSDIISFFDWRYTYCNEMQEHEYKIELNDKSLRLRERLSKRNSPTITNAAFCLPPGEEESPKELWKNVVEEACSYPGLGISALKFLMIWNVNFIDCADGHPSRHLLVNKNPEGTRIIELSTMDRMNTGNKDAGVGSIEKLFGKVFAPNGDPFAYSYGCWRTQNNQQADKLCESIAFEKNLAINVPGVLVFSGDSRVCHEIMSLDESEFLQRLGVRFVS